MSTKTLITKAVEAAFEEAGKQGNTQSACHNLFAGVPASKRDAVRTAWYDAIRMRAGMVNGKLIPVSELDNHGEKGVITKAAYACARKAYSREFPSTSGKRTVKAGKVTVTKAGGTAKAQLAKTSRSPKALASTLKVLVANLQAQEKPMFKDQPRLIAALQAALALAV